ncbi:MAG: hypothetical protein ACFFDX_07950 [Candidatus Odinarchaeota archaeon]
MKCSVIFGVEKQKKFEEEINAWLDQHPNAKIHHVTGVYNYLLIFYEE